jgi:multimeric flavodoxin WrbA
MKVLGIVASARKGGNSEVLVKVAAKEAQRLGSDINLIRLSDLNIKPCNGCLVCIMPDNKGCPIKDDISWLFEEMMNSDAFILGTPVYFLSHSSIIKSVIDRFFMLTYNTDRFYGKKAVTIVVSGRAGAEGITQSLLNLFPLILGVEIYGSVVVNSTLPGGILLNEKDIKNIKGLGARLIKGEKEEPSSDRCPLCWGRFFRLTKRGDIVCPFCYVYADLYKDGNRTSILFNRERMNKSPWIMRDWLRFHSNNIIKPLMERVEDDSKKIKDLMSDYSDTDRFFIKP